MEPRELAQPQVILRDVTKTTCQDFEKCANCYSDLTTNGDCYSFVDDITVLNLSIKVVDALDELTGLRKKLHLSPVRFDENHLVLCGKCSSVLTTLYVMLLDFVGASKEPSFLHGIFKSNKTFKRIEQPTRIFKREQDDVDLETFHDGDSSLLFPQQTLMESDKFQRAGPTTSGWSSYLGESEEDTVDIDSADDDPDFRLPVGREIATGCDNTKSIKSQTQVRRTEPTLNKNGENVAGGEVGPNGRGTNAKSLVDKNQRRYKCEVCAEMFTRTNHLTRHMKCHNLNNYSCGVCNAGFKTELRMLEHAKLHDPDFEARTSHTRQNPELSEVGTEGGSRGGGETITESNEKVDNENQKRTRTRRPSSTYSSFMGGSEDRDSHGSGNDTDFSISLDSDFEDLEFESSRRKTMKAYSKRKVQRKLNESGAESDPQASLSNVGKESGGKKLLGKTKYDKNAKRHKCEVCSELFSRTNHLIRHMKCHTLSTFTCSVCNAGFRNELRMQDHMKLHDPSYAPVRTGPRPKKTPNPDKLLFTKVEDGVQCGVCGKVLPDRHNIYSHLASHKGDSEKTIICEVCGRTFKTVQCLKRHIASHEDVREFLCSECGMAFKRRHHLREHIEVRHGEPERKYTCPEPNCNKSFVRSRNLRRHRILHGTTRFECELGCGAVFTCKFNRRVHQERSCKNATVHLPPRQRHSQKSQTQAEQAGPFRAFVETVHALLDMEPIDTAYSVVTG